MARMAIPICLITGVLAGVVAYTLTSSFLLVVTVWVASTCMVSLVLDLYVSRHPACQAAVATVRSLHPDWNVFTSMRSIRADENDRYVVAVFYSSPDVLVKPPRYVLVALGRAYDFIELLPVDPQSPYFIRGRK